MGIDFLTFNQYLILSASLFLIIFLLFYIAFIKDDKKNKRGS